MPTVVAVRLLEIFVDVVPVEPGPPSVSLKFECMLSSSLTSMTGLLDRKSPSPTESVDWFTMPWPDPLILARNDTQAIIYGIENLRAVLGEHSSLLKTARLTFSALALWSDEPFVSDGHDYASRMRYCSNSLPVSKLSTSCGLVFQSSDALNTDCRAS